MSADEITKVENSWRFGAIVCYVCNTTVPLATAKSFETDKRRRFGNKSTRLIAYKFGNLVCPTCFRKTQKLLQCPGLRCAYWDMTPDEGWMHLRECRKEIMECAGCGERKSRADMMAEKHDRLKCWTYGNFPCEFQCGMWRRDFQSRQLWQNHLDLCGGMEHSCPGCRRTIFRRDKHLHERRPYNEVQPRWPIKQGTPDGLYMMECVRQDFSDERDFRLRRMRPWLARADLVKVCVYLENGVLYNYKCIYNDGVPVAVSE